MRPLLSEAIIVLFNKMELTGAGDVIQLNFPIFSNKSAPQSEKLNFTYSPAAVDLIIPRSHGTEKAISKLFRTLEGIAGPQCSLTGRAQQNFLDLLSIGAKEFVRIVNIATLP